MSERHPDISVLIPVYNEAGNILPLLEEVMAALHGLLFEVIIVDDASTDGTHEALVEAQSRWPDRIQIRTHMDRAGKSAALFTGLAVARAAWIQLLDGDGQNDPADTRRVWDAHFAATTLPRTGIGETPTRLGLIAGKRTSHNDEAVRWFRTLLSRQIRKLILEDGSTDPECGWNFIRAEAFRDLPYFTSMHRYLPALVKRAGWSVLEEPVTDRPRRSGRSKYRLLAQSFASFFDLLGVIWLIKRGQRGIDKAWLEDETSRQ